MHHLALSAAHWPTCRSAQGCAYYIEILSASSQQCSAMASPRRHAPLNSHIVDGLLSLGDQHVAAAFGSPASLQVGSASTMFRSRAHIEPLLCLQPEHGGVPSTYLRAKTRRYLEHRDIPREVMPCVARPRHSKFIGTCASSDYYSVSARVELLADPCTRFMPSFRFSIGRGPRQPLAAAARGNASRTGSAAGAVADSAHLASSLDAGRAATEQHVQVVRTS